MATSTEIRDIAAGSLIQLTSGTGGIAVNSVLLTESDVRAYKSLRFTLPNTPTGAGEIQVQESCDPGFGSFSVVIPRRIDQNFAAPITSNPGGTYEVAVKGSHARMRVTTAYAGGTLASNSFFIWGSTAPVSLDGVPIRAVTSNTGQINPAADTPLVANARIRSLVFFNGTAVATFLQIHSSAALLTGASVPFAGYSIRVPAGSSLILTAADFGNDGRLFAANTRIGLSSTLGTFTALTAPNLALCSLNVETL